MILMKKLNEMVIMILILMNNNEMKIMVMKMILMK